VSAIKFLADGRQLTLFELGHAQAALAVGRTDQCRIHQLQDCPFTEGMRDDLGAPPLLAEQPLEQIGNRYEDGGAACPCCDSVDRGIWCDHPGQGHREHKRAGRPMHTMSCELVLVAGRPLRLARLRRERGSVVVVSPAAPMVDK
jgi:hypothetical protein